MFLENTVDIYVKLLGEELQLWRPVQAKHLLQNTYEIDKEQSVPSDESWEFSPGDRVICKERNLSGELKLVALEISNVN